MAKLPDADEIAYMMKHRDDSLVPNIIACCSICGFASTIFLAIRFKSRSVTKARLGTDDWCVVAAWVLYIAFVICFALTTRYGGGRHIILVTNARMLQILNIVDEVLYLTSMALIKLSILSLYGRIFPTRWFHHTIIGATLFTIAWAISACFASIFQCTPISYGWDPTIIGGSCIDYGLVVLTASALNIASDFFTLIIPVPLVWKLNVSKRRKQLLTVTFAIGGSACIVSIVRLGFSTKVGSTTDGSWDNIAGGLVSTAELLAGILAACCPTYWPLYKHYISRTELTQPSYGTGGSGYKRGRSVNISTSNTVHPRGNGIGITEEINLVSVPKDNRGFRKIEEDERQLYGGSNAENHW